MCRYVKNKFAANPDLASFRHIARGHPPVLSQNSSILEGKRTLSAKTYSKSRNLPQIPILKQIFSYASSPVFHFSC